MNIREIAKLAGVSVSTVSKVINNKADSIRPETRERVLQIAKEHHYTPYASVILPKLRTFQIGVVLRRFEESGSILSGILSAARSSGYTVGIAETGDDPAEELRAAEAFCQNQADVVLIEASEHSDGALQALSEAGIPFLCFHSEHPDAFNINYGYLGYYAVQSLLDCGHRSIACVLADKARTPGFFKGYKRCLFDNELPFQEEYVFHDVNEMLFELISARKLSAVVCSHYSDALRLFALCADFHCRTPEDFSLISLKDDCRTEASYPRISAYPVPHAEFGRFLFGKAVAIAEGAALDPSPFSVGVSLDCNATIDAPPAVRSSRITVVGSINVDHYLNVSALPTSGNAVRSTRSSVYPGGKATNEAIGAAKLGHAVSLLGNVGDDTDANLIFSALLAHGVDTAGLSRCPGLPTGKAYIIVEAGGDSLVSILSGASEQLRPEGLRLRRSAFQHSAFTLINTEIPMDTVLEACRLTHETGGKTIVKPAACTALPEDLLPEIDILIPNRREMDELLPGPGNLSEKASFFLSNGVKTVIVTLGAEGCFLKTETLERYFPAAEFLSVDNTGAADAFIAALASYLLYGYSLQKAIRIATYAAGFCITREGTVPALIDRNSLEACILRKEPELLDKATAD